MKYRVHRFGLEMTKEQDGLALFLKGLEREIVAIILNHIPLPYTL